MDVEAKCEHSQREASVCRKRAELFRDWVGFRGGFEREMRGEGGYRESVNQF